MDLTKSISEIHGALREQKTLDEGARRRHTVDQDADYFNLIPPYRLDALCKIMPSKSFRRLELKTQVMPNVRINTHVRKRSSHTHEVASIAATISEILGLNTDLCLAGSFGHDIGHAPFGHIGESRITHLSEKNFRHHIFSVVLAQHIERSAQGLNLTHQTLSAIFQHSRGKNVADSCLTASAEANTVMLADKIGYTWGDIQDCFWRQYLDINAHPELRQLINWFGANARERVRNTIFAVCRESAEAGKVVFQTSESAEKFEAIKKYMYQSIYPQLGRDALLNPLIDRVYDYMGELEPNVHPAIAVALMTDAEATTLAGTERRDAKNILSTMGVMEILPFLRDRAIDFTNPDLDW